MKWKLIKCFALIISLAYLICCPVEVTYALDQGTDGTELEVMQPSQLEVYLGEEWAGALFELETDVGLYPNTIPVGEDGTLRMEIGGSSKYILRLREAPQSDASSTDESETTNPIPVTESEASVAPAQTENIPEASVPNPTEPGQNTIAGIPVTHIVFFGGGLVIAVAALILIRMNQKKSANYDDEEDF